MRKVTLRMNEEQKYKVIKQLADHPEGNKKRAYFGELIPIELRLANINTIESANEFLNSYIKEFNQRFALPIDYIKSVFEEQPADEKINLILAVLTERVVDGGNSIKYKNDYYRMLDKDSIHVHYRKGTKVLVIEAFDQNIYCSVNDKSVHALEVIPEHERKSKEIDFIAEEENEKKAQKTKYIPSLTHPWAWKVLKNLGGHSHITKMMWHK